MIGLFNLFLYQPLFNLLVFLYNILPFHDIGLAIIILTVIIKLILHPFSTQSLKSQRALQKLQPQLEELKKKYKEQKERLASEMMLLYKKEKVNPFSSCLPLLIQLPFLIAVFQVFRSGLNPESLDLLYPFIQNPGQLNPVSLNIINLAEKNLILAIFAGLAQFFQAKMMVTKKPPSNIAGSKDEGMMAMMNKQMLYFMPIMTVVIGASLPGGLVLYWFLTTVLTILQQFYLFRKDKREAVKTL